MNKSYNIHFFFTIILLTILCSCSYNTDFPGGDGNETSNEVDVRVTIQMPAASKPTTTHSTRAITLKDENYVEEIDVLSFQLNSTSNQWELRYTAQGSDIRLNGNGGDNESKKQFTVRLIKDGKQQCFVILANARAQVQAITEANIGDEKNALLKELSIEKTGKWLAESDNFTPIPMWGETTQILSDANPTLPNVNMIRALARVDVIIDPTIPKEKFELTSVSIFYRNMVGRIVPDSNNVNTSKTKVTAPSEPDDPKKADDINKWNEYVYELVYDLQTGERNLTNSIYLFEAANPSIEENSPCIVVGGKYNENRMSTFYRVDFFDGDNSIDILRNHKYVITIEDVLGPGYEKAYVAADGKGENIPYSIKQWDDGEPGTIFFNKHNYIKVSPQTEIEIDMQGGSQVIRVQTDYPEGFRISDIGSIEYPMYTPWLTIDKDTYTDYGTGEVKVDIIITATENRELPREGSIHIYTNNHIQMSANIVVKQDGIGQYIGYFGGDIIDVGDGRYRFEHPLYVKNTNEKALNESNQLTESIKWKKSPGFSPPTNNWDGRANTFALRGDEHPAANQCFSINENSSAINSVADPNYIWYLPAQKQLIAIWAIYNSFDKTYGVNNSFYCTSTEYDYQNAWIFSFWWGNTADKGTKTGGGYVRCVREW